MCNKVVKYFRKIVAQKFIQKWNRYGLQQEMAVCMLHIMKTKNQTSEFHLNMNCMN